MKFWLAILCLMASAVRADAGVNFVRDVQPILNKHCYSCHGPKLQKSGLRLDIKAAAFHGGELYGASIVAKQASKSPLVQFIADDDADLKMPPEGKGLSKKEIAILRNWVNDGAVWPEGVDRAKLIDKRDHWSFKPIDNPEPPQIKNEKWPKNSLDRFILSRLENEGLSPAKESSRVDWLRRVSFDLIGLPPTINEVKSFVKNESPLAFERVVDRLLASPRYGERFAQHWLDVVRYADTHGFEVNTERPNAWPYRDYVIDAFNKDTPYDQFVKEQIVGDAIDKDAATGFLITSSVLLPGQIGKDEPSKRLARQDEIDEMVVNISQTFLGLSIGCARCHDHKFDPVSQEEYYSMQTFVAGVYYADRDLHSPIAEKKRDVKQRADSELRKLEFELTKYVPLAKVKNVTHSQLRDPINAQLNVDRFKPITSKRIRFTINATNNLEPCIDELEVFDVNGENIALSKYGTKSTASGSIESPGRHGLAYVNDGVYGNNSSWMANTNGERWVQLEFPKATKVDRIVWGRDRKERFKDRLATDYKIEASSESGEWTLIANSKDRQKFNPRKKKSKFVLSDRLDHKESEKAKEVLYEQTRLKKLILDANRYLKVFAGQFKKPQDIHLLRRGDPEQPLEKVLPAVPSVLGSIVIDHDTSEQKRREILADWIANRKNPLTARVMVNRIWLSHFGTGLVDTPNDFGRNGTKPSHPKLLDFLATQFMQDGWSIKKLHRMIVLSATYRQSAKSKSTKSDSIGMKKDASVRLLWRYPTQRLTGETIRDSILHISGELDLKMYGPGYNLFNLRGGLVGFKPIEKFSANGLRRMVYAHRVRRERDAVFGAFDCPDGGQSLPNRKNSTTPIQALNLFNSRFVIDHSRTFARRIQTEVGSDIEAQIRQAYLLALSREPKDVEFADAKSVVSAFGLQTLCRAIYNSNEFLFIP